MMLLDNMLLQFKDALEQDLSASPVIKTCVDLRDRLETHLTPFFAGYPPNAAKQFASSIASRINIDVDESFVAYEKYDELIDIFAQVIAKLYQTLSDKGFSMKDFEHSVASSKFEIKYR